MIQPSAVDPSSTDRRAFCVSLYSSVFVPRFAIVALLHFDRRVLWLIGVPCPGLPPVLRWKLPTGQFPGRSEPRFIPHCGRGASSPVWTAQVLPPGSEHGYWYRQMQGSDNASGRNPLA